MGTATSMPDDRYTIKDCCGCEHVKLCFNLLNIYLTGAQSPKLQISWQLFDWSKLFDLQQGPSCSKKAHGKSVAFNSYDESVWGYPCLSKKLENWRMNSSNEKSTFQFPMAPQCHVLYWKEWLAHPTYFCALYRKMAKKRCHINTAAIIDHLQGLLQQNVTTRFAVLLLGSPISVQIPTLQMWSCWWGILWAIQLHLWPPVISKPTLAKCLAKEWLLTDAIRQIKTTTSGHSHYLSCWVINRKNRQWFTLHAWDGCTAGCAMPH